jgi:ABC-type glycerol-3-phosphate transport system substrate-binding protein
MKKLLQTSAFALVAGSMALSSGAFAQDKITMLTWNISIIEDKVAGWTEEFHKTYPDIEVEWLDRKGTEWVTFYQTQ